MRFPECSQSMKAFVCVTEVDRSWMEYLLTFLRLVVIDDITSLHNEDLGSLFIFYNAIQASLFVPRGRLCANPSSQLIGTEPAAAQSRFCEAGRKKTPQKTQQS